MSNNNNNNNGKRIITVTLYGIDEFRPGDKVISKDDNGFVAVVEREINVLPEPLTEDGKRTIISFYGNQYADTSDQSFLYVAMDNGDGFWHVVGGGPVGLQWGHFVEHFKFEDFTVLARKPATLEGN